MSMLGDSGVRVVGVGPAAPGRAVPDSAGTPGAMQAGHQPRTLGVMWAVPMFAFTAAAPAAPPPATSSR